LHLDAKRLARLERVGEATQRSDELILGDVFSMSRSLIEGDGSTGRGRALSGSVLGASPSRSNVSRVHSLAIRPMRTATSRETSQRED
jgi:hypothetical protein